MLMTYIQNMLMNFESEPEPATSASSMCMICPHLLLFFIIVLLFLEFPDSSKVAAEEPSTLYCNVVKNWFLVLNVWKYMFSRLS